MCVAIFVVTASTSLLRLFDLSTEELASCTKRLHPSFVVLGNGSSRNLFPFVEPDLSLKIVEVFWIFFFFMRMVSPLLFHHPAKKMHPAIALEKSTLRRMNWDFPSCYRVCPTQSASPDFYNHSDLTRKKNLSLWEKIDSSLQIATWTHIFSLLVALVFSSPMWSTLVSWNSWCNKWS